jgi:CRP-like cAMP-binding protein
VRHRVGAIQKNPDKEGGVSMATSQMLAQDVFSYLRPEQIDAIHNASQVVERRAGEVVYTQGDGAKFLYVVLEGKVALRLPGKKGLSILIELLDRGTIFGAGASFALQAYTVTAQCLADSKLLKIDASLLQHLMEDDCRMGYAIQKRISDLYFKRYIKTMLKFQEVVASIPLEATQ